MVFHNESTTTKWFARWGVALTTVDESSASKYVDFATGKIVASPTTADAATLGAAFQGYGTQLAKYPDVQNGFNLTYPVADDLVLPFGDFLDKYNLSAMAYYAYIFAQGYSPIMDVSTLYVIKNFGTSTLTGVATNSFLTTASHNTHALYDAIYAKLPSLFMLNASVLQVVRTSDMVYVKLAGDSKTGKTTLIKAKKLVWAAPPTVSNFDGAAFALSSTERAVFSQFFGNGYYTALISNSGLPDGTSIEASTSGERFQVGKTPGPYMFATIDGLNLTSVYFGTSSTTTSDADVKSAILTALSKYKSANGITSAATPSWAVFKSHTPFNLMVSSAAIKDKFYQKLYALQGVNSTFYNGAAWHTQDSGLLWKFTDDYILPIILASF